LEVSSAKDLDYLFGKLKGDGSELMKAIEEEVLNEKVDMAEEEELVITTVNKKNVKEKDEEEHK